MILELCRRHRNTFPRILSVVILAYGLNFCFFVEYLGVRVTVFEVCLMFFIAFPFFLYGQTAPPEMKKKPLSAQLSALCKDFFQRLWPICFFCEPEPMESLYPPEPLELPETIAIPIIIEPIISVKVLESKPQKTDHLPLPPPQKAKAPRITARDEYFLLFESITPEGEKRSFKETLSILEERYHADNPFVGRTANFYFADGKYIKHRHNGSPIEIRQKTLENRYSSFLNTKKS